jgi:hypothetical protein
MLLVSTSLPKQNSNGDTSMELVGPCKLSSPTEKLFCSSKNLTPCNLMVKDTESLDVEQVNILFGGYIFDIW